MLYGGEYSTVQYSYLSPRMSEDGRSAVRLNVRAHYNTVLYEKLVKESEPNWRALYKFFPSGSLSDRNRLQGRGRRCNDDTRTVPRNLTQGGTRETNELVRENEHSYSTCVFVGPYCDNQSTMVLYCTCTLPPAQYESTVLYRQRGTTLGRHNLRNSVLINFWDSCED